MVQKLAAAADKSYVTWVALHQGENRMVSVDCLSQIPDHENKAKNLFVDGVFLSAMDSSRDIGDDYDSNEPTLFRRYHSVPVCFVEGGGTQQLRYKNQALGCTTPMMME